MMIHDRILPFSKNPPITSGFYRRSRRHTITRQRACHHRLPARLEHKKRIIPGQKLRIMDEEVEDDDLDVEQQSSRNNRGSKEVTELYYFVLALSLNEMSTNNESLSTEQQQELTVLNCDRWIGLLRSEFGNVYRMYVKKGGITEESIRAQAKQDTPKNMLRKAKEVASYINNQLSPHWKEPENSASGKGREGDFHPCNLHTTL